MDFQLYTLVINSDIVARVMPKWAGDYRYLTEVQLSSFIFGLCVTAAKINKNPRSAKRSGDFLLKKMAASYSPALHCSTIGAGGLNFSVRNGKRWDPAAITT